MATTTTFAAGDIVDCQFEGALGGTDLYRGHIAAVNADGTFNIQYDDGDQELSVDARYIVLVQPQNGSTTETYQLDYTSGDAVQCQAEGAAGGTEHFPARVAACNPDGTYNVVYEDGRYENNVDPAYLQPIRGSDSAGDTAAGALRPHCFTPLQGLLSTLLLCVATAFVGCWCWRLNFN